MRILLSTLSGLAVVTGTCLAWGAGADSQSSPSQSPATMIDGLAQQIFSQADKNHNDNLSKIEFARARATLTDEVESWGQQGLIGKPLKGKAKTQSKQPAAPVDVGVAGDRLARSNKVSLAEFMYFAHAVLTDADQNWRQMHADEAARRKLASEQRKALNEQRRAGRLRGRTVFGIPF